MSSEEVVKSVPKFDVLRPKFGGGWAEIFGAFVNRHHFRPKYTYIHTYIPAKFG